MSLTTPPDEMIPRPAEARPPRPGLLAGALAALLALTTVAQAQKGVAPAPPAPPPPNASGRSSDAAAVAALPPQIGGWQRQDGLTDYEARPNGRGFGASVNYELPSGSPYATVYLYNRNRSDLIGSAVGPAVDQELGITRREIEGASERRGYRIGSVRACPTSPAPMARPPSAATPTPSSTRRSKRSPTASLASASPGTAS